MKMAMLRLAMITMTTITIITMPMRSLPAGVRETARRSTGEAGAGMPRWKPWTIPAIMVPGAAGQGHCSRVTDGQVAAL